MMCENPKLDVANMNACIKFGDILLICSQENEWNRNLGINKEPYLSVRKMKCIYQKVDLVNIHAYIKFGEILSVCSQDFERYEISV